jgi:hypothetical protein
MDRIAWEKVGERSYLAAALVERLVVRFRSSPVLGSRSGANFGI